MIDFNSDWPQDADGDVFRRMQEKGFDFSRRYAVDYNVDFAFWPPSSEAVAWLEQEFGKVSLYPPNDNLGGFAMFQVLGPVTYDGVTSIQRRVSTAMSRFDGICETWGVYAS